MDPLVEVDPQLVHPQPRLLPHLGQVQHVPALAPAHSMHRLQLGSKYFLLIKYFLFCKIFLLLVEIFLVLFLTLLRLRQGREGDF